MSDKVALYKFELTTGKTIHLREPKISHTRTASQIAGKKAGDNSIHLQVLMQEEIVKILLVKINDQELKGVQKENLDDIFTLKEYNQVVKAVQMIEGDDVGEPQMAIDTGGN